MDDPTIDPRAPVNLPSAWLAEATLSEAMAFLAANPDLVDDEDIALALASEVPNALALVDAFTMAAQVAGDAADMLHNRSTILARRSAIQRRKESRLRDQIPLVLLALKLKRKRTPAGLVSLKQNHGGVIITDELALPQQYVTITTIRTPNRGAIREALQSGAEVPGATLSNGTPSIRIT